MIFFFFSFFASLIGMIKAQGSILSHISFLPLSASNPFSGIISFWPFIVALVLLLLAVLWYQTIKGIRKRRAQNPGRKQPAAQSTFFLGVITVLVLVLLAAPWYLETFSDDEATTTQTTEENRVETLLTVHGMDCGGCESLINRRVASLDGVETVEASHVRQEVMVVYDKSKVNLAMIAQTIEESGYTVVME